MSKPLGASNANRWRALVFIALAQLMVVLDSTIVNIALPSVQHDLGISDGDRQWVVTAYALAFGGLLLFGGRISDLWGRKRAFVVGLVGFAGASALGGAAVNEAMMFGARALQGVFGAVLAPAALSLLAVMFPDGKERARAFGVFTGISGGGAAVGFVLGGVLTEYLDWRWTFFVNIPFAIVAALGACFTIREPTGGRGRSRLDIPGAVLSTLGLVCLVYAFARAENAGWSDSATVGLFVASVVLLAIFVIVEARSEAPLLPLPVLTERNRGGAYLSLGLAIIGMFGTFLFLTYYLQIVKGYSPIGTGFAFLPLVVGMTAGASQIGARLVTWIAPRLVMGPALLGAALGLVLLTRLGTDSSYVSHVLPGMLLLGLGIGTATMPAISLSAQGVEPRDAGVASAMVNTSQQVGGAIGTALLNTIAASATATYFTDHLTGATGRSPRQLVQMEGMVHGYTVAIWFAVGILVLAAAIAVTFINAGRPSGAASTKGIDVESVVPVVAH